MIITDFDVVSKWVSEQTDCSIPRVGATIGWLGSDGITCGVLYEDFTGSCITATIAISSGTTVSPKFIWAIFDYPFNQSDCKKMLACVKERNLPSQALVERMGFIREAVIADGFPDEAMIIYSVTRETCRYLERRHGKKFQDTTST